MELMFIQKFQIPFGNFKDLTTKPAYHTMRGQQKVAFNPIFVCVKLDSDHDLPPPKDMWMTRVSQVACQGPLQFQNKT